TPTRWRIPTAASGTPTAPTRSTIRTGATGIPTAPTARRTPMARAAHASTATSETDMPAIFVFIASLLFATGAAAQGPVTYAWFLTCPPDGGGFGPWAA